MPTSPATELTIKHKHLQLSLRTRITLFFMRVVGKPLLSRMMRGSVRKISNFQVLAASMEAPKHGINIDYQILGRSPGHTLGDINQSDQPIILWLHGGAFIMPAAPNAHLDTAARLCKKLGIPAFVPDYRLAPMHRFPAALDDCEEAYMELLSRGFAPERIALIGDSAGGNLLFGLLQRLRKRGVEAPACGIPVSPVTELSRIHGLPSRGRLRKGDVLLPISAFSSLGEAYIGEHDASDPEMSPLYMDCQSLPPLQFFVSDNEVLMDDGLYMARRCHEAGVDTECHLWPSLPHAFPLFYNMFPEVSEAHDEMAAFISRHTTKKSATNTEADAGAESAA